MSAAPWLSEATTARRSPPRQKQHRYWAPAKPTPGVEQADSLKSTTGISAITCAQRLALLADRRTLDHLGTSRQDAFDRFEILPQAIEFLQRHDDVDPASALARHDQLGDPVARLFEAAGRIPQDARQRGQNLGERQVRARDALLLIRINVAIS